jgi:hypothetical protein
MSAEDVGALFAYGLIAFIGFVIVLAIAGPAVRYRRGKEKRLRQEVTRLQRSNAKLADELKAAHTELYKAYHWQPYHQPTDREHTRVIRLEPTYALPQADAPQHDWLDEFPSR